MTSLIAAQSKQQDSLPLVPLAKGFKIMSKVECEGAVHFEVFESCDLLAVTDESHKIVNFYSLKEALSKGGSLPTALHQQ